MPSGKRAGETRGPTKKGGKQKQSLTTEAPSQGTSSFSLDGSSGKLPTPKKSKTIEKTGSTSISESILTHFSPIATRLRSTSDNMDETETSIDRDETGSLDGPSSQLNQSPIEASSGMPTNADIMKKLCSNGYQIEKLGRVIEELRGTILLLQLDNDIDPKKRWRLVRYGNRNYALISTSLHTERHLQMTEVTFSNNTQEITTSACTIWKSRTTKRRHNVKIQY